MKAIEKQSRFLDIVIHKDKKKYGWSKYQNDS